MTFGDLSLSKNRMRQKKNHFHWSKRTTGATVLSNFSGGIAGERKKRFIPKFGTKVDNKFFMFLQYRGFVIFFFHH